jgi:hypothetical protein
MSFRALATIPQGLKAAVLAPFAARLKPCPDTNPVFETRSTEKMAQRNNLGILACGRESTVQTCSKRRGMRIRKAARVTAICFCMGAISLFGQSSVRIGGESLRANGQLAQGFQYTGSCPVDLQFGWGVIGTGPSVMSYHFVRSDGGHSSSSLSANLPQANRSVPVYEKWRLGANSPQFANYTGWVKLMIDSPNQVEGKIGFTIHCR